MSSNVFISASGAFLLGLSLGYAIKKSFKITIFLMGITILALFFFEAMGVMSISTTGLEGFFDTTYNNISQLFTYLFNKLHRYQNIGMVGVIGGFILGLKMG